ncbi:hypothetical protein [Emticicia sp. C21]|uniref:hypothetical protein n=1 Tax=Emticicia sp. C21 TaxID=2302915 RepID=UPI000E349AA4|nr:hypothetical protein [Emticicia sp. C21]RFS17042.1 hypothetical protein D0T08_10220 [Emticicia sp. C21]
MNILLRLKTWHLFVLLMSPRLLSLFFLNNINYTNLLAGLNGVLYFGFFILSYEFLRQFDKERKPIQRIFFFLINSIFACIFVAMALNGYSLDFLETVLLLPIFITFMGHVLYVLAKKQNKAEKLYNLSSQAVFLYMLLYLLLPLGIWIIVPQFKKLKTTQLSNSYFPKT